MVRKHCRKRRKCCLPAFSPFPTMFSKGFFFRVVKSRDGVVELNKGSWLYAYILCFCHNYPLNCSILMMFFGQMLNFLFKISPAVQDKTTILDFITPPPTIFAGVKGVSFAVCLSLRQFVVFSSTGQRAYVMAHCLLCIRPCVNFFFKHLLLWNYSSIFYEILQKCSCHCPLQNFLKEFDSFKNSLAMATKLKKNWKSSCQKP